MKGGTVVSASGLVPCCTQGAELRGGVGVGRPRRFPQILYTQLIFTVLDPG